MKNPTGHPARYSDAIIDHFKTLLHGGERVHDPFAGTGEQLGRLADEIGFYFTGRELEPMFIVDRRVRQGDSTRRKAYPRIEGWTLVTSPTYPNGNADYFASSADEAKPWKRNTYRHSIVRLSGGQQTDLAATNMARFGYRGTKRSGISKARREFWDLARKCVGHWYPAERCIVNVSDFYSGDVVEPFVADWIEMMEAFGWKVSQRDEIITPRYRNGSDESRDQRVESEAVIIFSH